MWWLWNALRMFMMLSFEWLIGDNVLAWIEWSSMIYMSNLYHESCKQFGWGYDVYDSWLYFLFFFKRVFTELRMFFVVILV